MKLNNTRNKNKKNVILTIAFLMIFATQSLMPALSYGVIDNDDELNPSLESNTIAGIPTANPTSNPVSSPTSSVTTSTSNQNPMDIIPEKQPETLLELLGNDFGSGSAATTKGTSPVISSVWHNTYHVKNYEDVDGYLVEATVTDSDLSSVQIKSDLDGTFRTMEHIGSRYYYIIDMGPAGYDWDHYFTIRAIDGAGHTTTYTDSFESSWEYKGRYSDSTDFETRTGTTDVTYHKGHYNVIKQSTGGDARHTISWSVDTGYFETWLCVDGRVSSPDTYIYLTESSNLNKYIYFRYAGTTDTATFGSSQVSDRISTSGFIDARPSNWNHVKIKFEKKLIWFKNYQRITAYIDGTKFSSVIDIPWADRVNVNTIRLTSTRAYWDCVSPEWTNSNYFLNDLKSKLPYHDLEFTCDGPTDYVSYSGGSWHYDYIYDRQQSVSFDYSSNANVMIRIINRYEAGASFTYSSGTINYVLPDTLTVSSGLMFVQNPTKVIGIRKGNAVLHVKHIRIKDDDTTVPSIQNVYVDNLDPSISYWSLYIRASDYSGISSARALFNGQYYTLSWNSQLGLYGNQYIPKPAGVQHGDQLSYNIYVTDGDGDRTSDSLTKTATSTVTFRDNTAPSTAIVICSNGNDETPMTVQYSLSDASGIDYIQYFYIKDGVTSTLTNVQFNNPISVSSQLSLALPRGSYRVYIRGVDRYGNSGGWGSDTGVIVDDDTTAPTIQWLNLNSDVSDGDSERRIGFKISDSGSGLSSFQVKLYRNGIFAGQITKTDLNGQTTRYWLYDLSNKQLATYRLEVSVTDNDDDITGDQLTTTGVSNTVTYYDDDVDIPDITTSYSGDYTDGNSGTVTFTASDSSSGIHILNGDLVNLVPAELGNHTYVLTVEDTDYDRPDDQLIKTESITIAINDDDTTGPTITSEYFGSGTDGDSGFVRFTANDESGIYGDSIVDIALNPNIINQAQYITATFFDNDNDRLNDRLSSSLTVPITLDDDDVDCPEVNYVYTGDYTDENPGLVIFTASDSQNMINILDGQSEYQVPSELGDHIFAFTVEDTDYDRPNDQLIVAESVTITIIDDDIMGPTITSEYIGSGTDGNPGFVRFTANDASGIYGSSIVDISVDPNIINQAQYITATFSDDDNDRLNDRLSSSLTIPITLVDDDTTVDIINLNVNVSIDKLSVTFDDTDASGINNCDWVKVDGSLISYDYASGLIEFTNEWILELGMHSIEFQLTDSDADRINDAEIKSFSVNFEITQDLIVEFLLKNTDELRQMVIGDMPSDCWKHAPNGNGKGKSGESDGTNPQYAMLNKIDELDALILAGEYDCAMNKFIHDIVPKLTGIKANGDEFNNPWVVGEIRQQDYSIICDDITFIINFL
jgi:hypothetical protein